MPDFSTPDFSKRRALSHSDSIPSPFLDYASLHMPTNINESFEMAEAMYYSNRTFAQAIEYVVSYFTGTDLNVLTKDEDKAAEYKKFLLEKQQIKTLLFLIGRDIKVYSLVRSRTEGWWGRSPM